MEMFYNILFFVNGKIVKSGTHNELVEQEKYYKKLINFQNQNIILRYHSD